MATFNPPVIIAKVGDRVRVTYGSHQDEEGRVTQILPNGLYYVKFAPGVYDKIENNRLELLEPIKGLSD